MLREEILFTLAFLVGILIGTALTSLVIDEDCKIYGKFNNVLINITCNPTEVGND
jgi:hypothetical protein